MLIDTHAHVMDDKFSADFDLVLKRAQDAGVDRIINVGCGLDFTEKSLEMAGRYNFLYATVGLHPYDAADCSDDLIAHWQRLAYENDKIVAIGETGLDYVKANVSHEIQKQSFRSHLELAKASGLPVIVHNRGADDDVFEMLTEFPHLDAVFHCYGSDLNFAEKVWAAGYITSFSGIITFPNALELHRVVMAAPMGQFFVETDCPYLAPQAYRGQRNEPSFVVEVAKKVAELKGIPFEEVVKASTKNAERVFTRMLSHS